VEEKCEWYPSLVFIDPHHDEQQELPVANTEFTVDHNLRSLAVFPRRLIHLIGRDTDSCLVVRAEQWKTAEARVGLLAGLGIKPLMEVNMRFF
jgi:hypothetical protein